MRARHQGNRYRLCRDYRGFFTKTRGTEGGMRAEQEGKQPRQGAVCSGGGGPTTTPPVPVPLPPEPPRPSRGSANLRPVPGPTPKLGLAGREMAISTTANKIIIITTIVKKPQQTKPQNNRGRRGQKSGKFFCVSVLHGRTKWNLKIRKSATPTWSCTTRRGGGNLSVRQVERTCQVFVILTEIFWLTGWVYTCTKKSPSKTIFSVFAKWTGIFRFPCRL